MNRKPAQAGLFYPGTLKDCQELIENCLNKAKKTNVPLAHMSAGIAPHAGWVYSGPTAASVFQSILKGNATVDTFILFGAVHVPGVDKASVWLNSDWDTPLGTIKVNQPLAEKLSNIDKEILDTNNKVHTNEHSLEVLVPFIQHLFPSADIVPIMIPPRLYSHKIGEFAAQLTSENAVAIGSTDMTHYGTRFGFTPQGIGPSSLEWVKKQNDRRMIDLMLELKEDQVVKEASQNRNACGSGAIAATLAFAKAKNKESGVLLDYTTSQDVFPDRVVDSFVGYSGLVF